MVDKARLRIIPPEEYIRYDGKRPVAVQFRCQLCLAVVRTSYRPVQFQVCDDCNREPLSRLFSFDLLPHSRILQELEDIR